MDGFTRPWPIDMCSSKSSAEVEWLLSTSPHDVKHSRRLAAKVLHSELTASVGTQRLLREFNSLPSSTTPTFSD